MVGWHHQYNGCEPEQTLRQWRTGKPGELQSMGSQTVGNDWATELNWCGQLENVPCTLEKNVCTVSGGCNVWNYQAQIFIRSFRIYVSLLIFCIEDLSIDVSGMLKSPIITVFMSISPFMSLSICFMYLGPSISQFSSVAQSCPTLCDPMNRSTPGLPVHYQLPELTQTHIHWVSDAIQPSHPVVSFSSCLQPFPASGSFLSQLFASGGQSIGVSASTSVSNEHPGLISFRMDWLDLLAVQGTLKSLLQHHSSKPSILRH